MISLKNDSINFNVDDEESYNNKKKISLEVNMKIPIKDAPLYLFLKNASGTDVRRYKVFINSVYKPLKYEMEMKIPVNQKLTQPLPLINVSDFKNTFNVSLSLGDNSKNIFSINKDREVSVESNEHGTVEV